jgi:hypothetical protein
MRRGTLLVPQHPSHISHKARDTPNFLHAALDTSTRAPFVKERRMKFPEPTRLHRKSGIWGTLYCLGKYWLSHPTSFTDDEYRTPTSTLREKTQGSPISLHQALIMGG